MKKQLLLWCLMISCTCLQAQKITKILLIGENGKPVTESKLAKSFIAVKKYPDGRAELLDYTMRGPLRKTTMYADGNLTKADGPSYEYHENGFIKWKGSYAAGNKDGDWAYYNDSGKYQYKERYAMGSLLETVRADSVEANTKEEHPGDHKAGFIGKNNAWRNYLLKTLNPDIAARSVNGGTVQVYFAININGRPADIHVWKSVEYVLDEEALRVIYDSPDWSPEVHNGETIRAYRVQPITFSKE